MNKLCPCCCDDNDLPDITVNVTCACCESRVEEHSATDMPDSDTQKEEETLEQKVEEQEDAGSYCCCFGRRRKRHAKSNKKRRKQL